MLGFIKNNKWWWRSILCAWAIKLVFIIYGNAIKYNGTNHFLQVLHKNDANWYKSIVENGYPTTLHDLTVQTNVVFFPLYPLLVKPFYLLTQHYLVAATLLSCLLLVLLISSLFRYFRAHNLSDQNIFWFTLFLQAMPFHYFLHVHYSELLFLLLLINLLYYAEKKKALEIFVYSALLVLCRPTGLLFAFSILLLQLSAQHWRMWFNKTQLKTYLAFIGAPMGLAVYAFYLHHRLGNALAFSQNQIAWDRHYTWPWKSFIQPGIELKFLVWYSLILLIIATWTMAKTKFKNAWVIIPNLVFPLCTGTVLSFYRFFMVTFPVFSTLATTTAVTKNKWLILVLFLLNLATYTYWIINGGVLSY